MATRDVPFSIDKGDGTGLLVGIAATATVQYGTGAANAVAVTIRGNGYSVPVDDTQDALVVVTAAGAITFGITVMKIPSVVASNMVAEAPSADTIAVAVEGHLLNEVDGQELLEAIVTAINTADVDVAGLSVTAIASATADAVWDAPDAAHQNSGTFGLALSNLGSSIGTTIATLSDSGFGLSAIKAYLVDKLVTVGVKVATNADKTGYKLDTTAGPGNANNAYLVSQVTTSLNTYDAPTRAEATTDKQAVLDAVADLQAAVEGAVPDGYTRVTHVEGGELRAGSLLTPFLVTDTAHTTPVNDPVKVDTNGEWAIDLPTGDVYVLVSQLPNFGTVTTEVTT